MVLTINEDSLRELLRSFREEALRLNNAAKEQRVNDALDFAVCENTRGMSCGWHEAACLLAARFGLESQ